MTKKAFDKIAAGLTEVLAIARAKNESVTAPALTKAQQAALKALQDNGGEGVFDRYGRVIARGEVLKTFSGATWARLMTIGAIVPAGKNRVKIASTQGDRT